MINFEEELLSNGVLDKKKYKKFKEEFLLFDKKYAKRKPISISSRKAKGRSLMLYVRDLFRQIFKDQLKEGDIECTVGYQTGRDIRLSPLGDSLIPFDVEAKYQENINMYGTIEQCLQNTGENRIPLIVFRKNNLKPWVALQLKDFMKIKYGIEIGE